MIDFSFGLIFWMFISFMIVMFILGKFAWKPILKALGDREQKIDDALREAELARAEIASMKAQNEVLEREAREEREVLLREAREIKEKVISDAKTKAQDEADGIIARAREDIRIEKMAAITELKTYVAELSLDMAEKVLKKELGDPVAQKALVEQALNDSDLGR